MFKIRFKKDDQFSQDVFEIMFESILIWGFLRKEKGRAVLAREDHNLLRLEEISKECDCGRFVVNKERARELDRDIDWTLTEQDRQFFIEYIDNSPWSAGKSGRKALKTVAFIEALREIKVSEPAPEVDALFSPRSH